MTDCGSALSQPSLVYISSSGSSRPALAMSWYWRPSTQYQAKSGLSDDATSCGNEPLYSVSAPPATLITTSISGLAAMKFFAANCRCDAGEPGIVEIVSV